ncbi:hypothetical protein [Paenarthrobacter sp. PH39-S1]|uniref:hypothetical protein n=1 Tax=Paenarthrobacter sp. PH39-S1 TaxID=3046204 RepID=UPI0024BB60EB|nr:hypothetical protein [Paenarthrobacter sp. PH39-S1]MDJ0356436.1 hypothetical protein [Paenarthrobacter sp. PH39-S1]
MPTPPVNDPQLPGDVPAKTPPAGHRPVRPGGVVLAAGVVGLEGLALLGVGIWYIVGLLTSVPQSLGGSIFMVVLLLGLGVGLGAVAVNLYRGFRWTRAAAFVWQLLMLTIAGPTLVGGLLLPGLLLLVPPLMVLVLLFTPKVVAFTLRSGGAPPVL